MSYLKPCYIHKHPGSDRRFVLDHLWQAINHSARRTRQAIKTCKCGCISIQNRHSGMQTWSLTFHFPCHSDSGTHSHTSGSWSAQHLAAASHWKAQQQHVLNVKAWKYFNIYSMLNPIFSVIGNTLYKLKYVLWHITMSYWKSTGKGLQKRT